MKTYTPENDIPKYNIHRILSWCADFSGFVSTDT